MKKEVQAWLIIFTLLGWISSAGCRQTPDKIFYRVLNDNFLAITDTIAYRTGRLILIPGDNAIDTSRGKLCILTDSLFADNAEILQSLKSALKNEHLDEYEKLLIPGNELKNDKIDLPAIINTGRYTLVQNGTNQSINCPKPAGSLAFYKPYINDERMVFAYSISDGLKAGYTTCGLFENIDGNWQCMKKIELMRW